MMERVADNFSQRFSPLGPLALVDPCECGNRLRPRCSQPHTIERHGYPRPPQPLDSFPLRAEDQAYDGWPRS
jgi:hypothetical protein